MDKAAVLSFTWKSFSEKSCIIQPQEWSYNALNMDPIKNIHANYTI